MRVESTFCEAAPEFRKDLPPVLLLHGMLDSRKSWDEIGPKIANLTGRKVYWLDARNHGDGPWTDDDFNFDFLAQDVLEFMKEKRIGKAVFVGSSMGGVTAMKLAIEKPQLVEKLVVEDMVPKPFPITGWKAVIVAISHMQQAVIEIPKNADEEAAKKFVMEYFRKQLPAMLPAKNEEFAFKVLPMEKARDGYIWQANLLAIAKAISDGKLDTFPGGCFTGDTLFLYGTESYMKVAEDETLPIIFPNAEFIPVQGATHMVHFEEPDEFVEKVVKFINGESQQPSSSTSS